MPIVYCIHGDTTQIEKSFSFIHRNETTSFLPYSNNVMSHNTCLKTHDATNMCNKVASLNSYVR